MERAKLQSDCFLFTFNQEISESIEERAYDDETEGEMGGDVYEAET
jgi:hypothetical protein